METLTLTDRWTELLKEQPNLRIRNAANELGVSEAELLATKIGDTVTLLRPEFNEILKTIESLGPVTAITRNDEVVHERKGVYLNGTFNPHVSMFVGDDIDLRIFLSTWTTAFAVEEPTKDSVRKSLQFFSKFGEAVHKIYLTPQSSEEAFDKIKNDFKAEEQDVKVVYENRTLPERADLNEDTIQKFQEGWKNLKDTHDFHPLLRKSKMTRQQALENAPEGYAIEVDPIVFRKAIESAASTELPIMVFVGNHGNIQIHTGPVKKLLDHQEWFNIMDPKFNLHVKEQELVKMWAVKKPTDDGMVHSIEAFNEKEELVCTLFGKRKPGIPELGEWSDLVNDLAKDYKV